MSLDPGKAALLRNAAEKAQAWTERRNELIAEAIGVGASLREVGDAAGLSHTAVKFIAHGRAAQ